MCQEARREKEIDFGSENNSRESNERDLKVSVASSNSEKKYHLTLETCSRAMQRWITNSMPNITFFTFYSHIARITKSTITLTSTFVCGSRSVQQGLMSCDMMSGLFRFCSVLQLVFKSSDEFESVTLCSETE